MGELTVKLRNSAARSATSEEAKLRGGKIRQIGEKAKKKIGQRGSG